MFCWENLHLTGILYSYTITLMSSFHRGTALSLAKTVQEGLKSMSKSLTLTSKLQIPILWDLIASVGSNPKIRRPSLQPTGLIGCFAKVLVDSPGHLQMFFDHVLTGHSSFGRIRRAHSIVGRWS